MLLLTFSFKKNFFFNKIKKIRKTGLDCTVLSNVADLLFMVLQAGIVVEEGWHPMLSQILPVYLSQISLGTKLYLGKLWLRLQSRHSAFLQIKQLAPVVTNQNGGEVIDFTDWLIIYTDYYHHQLT